VNHPHGTSLFQVIRDKEVENKEHLYYILSQNSYNLIMCRYSTPANRFAGLEFRRLVICLFGHRCRLKNKMHYSYESTVLC